MPGASLGRATASVCADVIRDTLRTEPQTPARDPAFLDKLPGQPVLPGRHFANNTTHQLSKFHFAELGEDRKGPFIAVSDGLKRKALIGAEL
ncbi:hypothetical protein [Ruegeria sp. HKCCSP346]|uniref:hypothetical protein n=1 Tax=Ruegeria sp. HKCCSP346 TaxID=2794830 RepID=UPI001FD73EE7|nr:hypothetical protein [Ruegeria sp. HKCCSP346]